MGDWFSKDIDLAVAAQLKQHFEKKSESHTMPFVTVSRMYGCDGNQLAKLIVEKMNAIEGGDSWAVVSREMILDAAEKGELTDKTLDQLESFGYSEVRSYVRSALFGMKDLNKTVERLGKIFHLMAGRGRMVFIGGGASIITSDMNTGVHVQLHASKEWRIKNHASRWSIEQGAATERVLDRTIDREAFVKTFLGEDLFDQRFYDLSINNEKVSAEEAAELVIQLIKARMD